MPDQGLQSGERVVEIAAVVHTASIVSGAIASTATTWLVSGSWRSSLVALVLGAFIGFVVSQFPSRLYSSGGQTAVAKVGSSSLSATVPAGLLGGVSVTLVVGIAVLWCFSAWSQAVLLLGTSLGCGLVVGVVLAILASLL